MQTVTILNRLAPMHSTQTEILGIILVCSEKLGIGFILSQRDSWSFHDRPNVSYGYRTEPFKLSVCFLVFAWFRVRVRVKWGPGCLIRVHSQVGHFTPGPTSLVRVRVRVRVEDIRVRVRVEARVRGGFGGRVRDGTLAQERAHL